MESFFLAETTKYLYLLFDTDNFIHNQGGHGTVINTPNGECIIETGGYIFNTEAHPVDPSALHCCHNVPKLNLHDFSQLNEKKSLFRGDVFKKTKPEPEIVMPPIEITAEMISFELKNRDSKEEATKDDMLSQITTESTMKLDNNDSYDIKSAEINFTMEDIGNETENDANIVSEMFNNQTFVKEFDTQAMLERIRLKNKYPFNKTWEHNYKLLSCKAQPFIQKLSIFGEFFNENKR